MARSAILLPLIAVLFVYCSRAAHVYGAESIAPLEQSCADGSDVSCPVCLAETNSGCADPRLPSQYPCVAKEMEYRSSACSGRAFLLTLSGNRRLEVDYYIYDYLYFVSGPGNQLVQLTKPKAMHFLERDMESDFEATLLPQRIRHSVYGRVTPLGELFSKRIEQTNTSTVCLSYIAKYPFNGYLAHCSDGRRLNTLRTADGVISTERAKQLAAAALAEQGLSVSNAEHFEGKQPVSVDVANDDGRWEYELRYDGRRRSPPYFKYLLRIPVTAEQVSITRQPWP